MRTTLPITPLHRGVATAAVAAIVVLSLSACGGGSSSTAAAPTQPESSMTMSDSPDPSTGSQPAGASMIMIKDFAYSGPASVKAGSTVQVMNMDTEAHTVTADSDGGFDVTVPPGKTVEFTAPSTPGSYAYHCTYHSNMHGTLHVR